MTNMIRVGACQTPEIIGNPPKALACILRFAKEAEDKNVDLLLFPECFLTGYILSNHSWRNIRMILNPSNSPQYSSSLGI